MNQIKYTLRNSLKILVIGCIFLLTPNINAQIHFPFGNTNNLNTSQGMVYLETRILFTTGKYQSDDYCWNKIYDSLDSRWFVSSCFNGDCKNDLLQAGCFIKDFGLNDTSCFIAFHVESHGFEGMSRIRYHVYNKKDANDQADLIFNISYSNPLGIYTEQNIHPCSVIPNPNNGNFRFTFPNETSRKIEISNSMGQILLSGEFSAASPPFYLKNRGIYYLKIFTPNGVTNQKIIVQ